MDATPSGPSFAPASTALGVPFMDAEHECLFGMYDELTRAVTSGASTKFFAERFSFLTPYAADHFSHEEFVMRKFEYSKYFEHRSQHERMLHDSEDFLRGVEEYYEPDECYALARLLSLWLKHHVDNHDRLLAHFIRWQTQNVSTLRQLPIMPPSAARSRPRTDRMCSRRNYRSDRGRSGAAEAQA